MTTQALNLGKLIIDGKSRVSRDGQFADVLNPATNEVIDRVPLATPEDVEEALDAARKGFKIWASTPTHERYDILFRFTHLLEKHKSELAEILTLENGKPLFQSEAEVDTGIRLFKGFAENLKAYTVSVLHLMHKLVWRKIFSSLAVSQSVLWEPFYRSTSQSTYSLIK
ncbi:aldehyde dehydrogenase family protein [Peribacillus frigoritolerans]|uniref:aldehyde dehydrogenase family protein n=1 Tax=Peribacillus frigoritolerans TaxID=450367 RepID=UPI0035146F09